METHITFTGITLRIKVDSIFQGNITTLSFSSVNEFQIKNTLNVIEIAKGVIDKQNNIFTAEASGKIFVLEFKCIGLILEKIVDDNDSNTSVNHYGMRFYPFVSSKISCIIKSILEPITNIIIEMPDTYRTIWYHSQVLNPSNKKAVKDHSYSLPNSSYHYLWFEENKTPGEYKVDISVRIGGTAFIKMTYYPIFYFLLALSGIFIASFEHKWGVIAAAIGASWAFIAKSLNSANMPQKNNLFSYAHYVVGVYILIWGIVCHFIDQNISVQIICLTMSVFALFSSYYLYKKTQVFELTGELKTFIKRFWLHKMIKADKKQIRSILNK